MARLDGLTFSNSGAADAEQFILSVGQFSATYNLLGQAPGSAMLYSIGVNNLTAGSTDNETQLPGPGSSGSIYVPTDLLAQDEAGYFITTALGATVTILSTDGQVSYNGGAALDRLGVGQHLTDSFLYAMATNGTVSWNTLTITLTGQAANIDLTGSTATYGVLEDQHTGSGTSLGQGQVDDGAGDLTDGTVHIH